MVTDRRTLLRQLVELGVRPGLPLMLHAGLRKIGPVEGGAEGLLSALVEVLGPQGTLLMPLGGEEAEPFDALRTPAEKDIGALAEIFRTRTGTEVNDHPAGRFGAVGAQAAELLEPTPLHHYYGPGSLLQRFTDLDGDVLRLGADPDTVTLTHFAEYVADVPAKRAVRRRYVRAGSGEVQWLDSLDDTDGITDWSGGDYFSQILIDFLAQGGGRQGTVGNCRAELLPGRELVAFAVRWMEERLT